MAEFLEEYREGSLPEYEQMKSLGIWPDEQIRDVMNKREILMKKIFQGPKTTCDYTKCIQCELLIHAWLSEKEKSLGKNLSSIKQSITTRIVNLYREALRKFPNELPLWENFILFSKKSLPTQVSGIYEKMLSYHGDKTRVWCDVGIWAYEHSGNMQKVNEIFFRALQRHASSETLNIIYFQILLQEASKIVNVNEREIGLERATLVYRNSKIYISNVSFYLKLLKCCEEEEQFVTMTAALQKEVIEDLMENFPREEMLWDALAQRELQGLSYIDLEAVVIKTKNEKAKDVVKKLVEFSNAEKDNEKDVKDNLNIKEQSIWKKRTLKRRIELCLHVYQTGLRSVPTTAMCSTFINAMLKLNQDLSTQQMLKRKCLATAFKEGHESKLMTEDYYNACIKMLLKHPNGCESAKKLLAEAAQLKQTPRYYEMWLTIYMVENNDEKLMEIFNKAKNDLTAADCVPLWSMVINFYKTRPDLNKSKLLEIIKDAAMQLSLEFAPFRAQYLQYYSSTMTLEKTRQVYDELSRMPPPCLEFHKTMADIESKAIATFKSNKTRWRQCYENAVYYFGKTNTQVWIDYIQFERHHGDPKNTTLIYQRAINTLSNTVLDSFIAEFTLLKTI